MMTMLESYKANQARFISKIYYIFFFCLAVTAGICVAPTINSDVQRYLVGNQLTLIVSSVLLIIPPFFLLYFINIAFAYACTAIGNA
ncbi:unnamed protein product [Moneuplotes crassus]|uniref:Uncharacterized protein n=1 Tax=Euplotes crassus TaxID=5936 RepID=A0AAD1XVI8_EUPCR|nr:unnamed protein product [Moneuplotes crassus]